MPSNFTPEMCPIVNFTKIVDFLTLSPSNSDHFVFLRPNCHIKVFIAPENPQKLHKCHLQLLVSLKSPFNRVCNSSVVPNTTKDITKGSVSEGDNTDHAHYKSTCATKHQSSLRTARHLRFPSIHYLNTPVHCISDNARENPRKEQIVRSQNARIGKCWRRIRSFPVGFVAKICLKFLNISQNVAVLTNLSFVAFCQHDEK